MRHRVDRLIGRKSLKEDWRLGYQTFLFKDLHSQYHW